MTINIFNQEGLELLTTIETNSVDLVLTDPPYITSKETGMDKWVKHVEKQDKPGAPPSKTENDWIKYVFEETGEEYWKKFFENSNVVNRANACKNMKENYLKYGSIYGDKYAIQTDFGEWDANFNLETLDKFVKEFYRVLRPGGTAIIFFDIWKLSDLKSIYESAKFKQLRFLEWIKTNPQPRNSNINYLTNCREVAVSAVKGGKPTFNSKYDNGIYEYPIYSGRDRFHPTQKNLVMFEELVKKHSNPGDLVLDPFLGSGTTAIAAKRHDRNFIGCEMDETFFKKTLERIKKV